MNGRRLIIALLPPLWLCMVITPCCFGNKNADIPKFDPPVQNYAVIDLCGSTVTSPVTLMALNDANQAAFAYPTGSVPWANGIPAKYHVYTWNNGTLSEEQIVDGYEPAGYPADGSPPPSIGDELTYFFKTLTATGTLYGTQGQNYTAIADDYASIAYAQSGAPNTIDTPSPPFIHMDANDHNITGGGLTNISESGAIVGSLQTAPIGTPPFPAPRKPESHFILNQGNYTIFDPTGDYSGTTIPNNVVIVPSQFYPYAANAQGWAIGGSDADGEEVWNGTDFIPLDSGDPVALNEQCQVIAQDYTPFGGIYSSGYLWETSSTTIICDQLPEFINYQYFGIQPTSISNQVKPAPAQGPASSDTDTTINILADADGIDVGEYGKMLWTRDNSGKWSFANIALPDGTTITKWSSINSSGVIAAIGNGGHALLLVPLDIEPDDSYVGGGGTNQTNALVNQDITSDDGNKGGMVDSIFKGDPSKHPQKHYVSPKSTEASPGDILAFKSGLPPSIAPAFEWISDNSGQTILPTGNDAAADVLVKRDLAAHVRLQIRVKSTTSPVDTMNAWVVWSTISTKDIPITAPDNGSQLTITGGYEFVHTIAPSQIYSKVDDIPNLKGTKDSDPPGDKDCCGKSLANGTDLHWDSSRQVREKYISSSSAFPASCKDKNGAEYPAENVGNDDSSNGDETNNPYEDDGILSGIDYPSRINSHMLGTANDAIEYRLQFREFTRLEIGKHWHRISAYYPWRIHLKFKWISGKWTNDSSTKATDNENF